MRQFLAGSVTAVFLAVPAIAADMPVKAPVMRAPAEVVAYNWTGFYIGGHVGGVWGNKDQTQVSTIGVPIAPLPLGSHDVSGFLGGGQVGFNWQTGRLVLGVEAQFSWTNADGDHVIQPLQTTRMETKLNWLGSASARLGYAWDRTLLYVKGGAAWVDEDYFVVLLPVGVLPETVAAKASDTRWGWMVGAGAELALIGNWSAKIEYNYMHFGTERTLFEFTPVQAVPCCDIDIDQHLHVVKFGINYRFGGGAPVVARY